MQENRVAPSIHDIVVTGIAGSGKTTLINRLSGSTTEGDHDLQHVGQLQSTPCSLGDYGVVLWETPDISDMSQDIYEMCPKPSVVVLCINTMSTRFSSLHDQMLDNISHYFKKSIWKNCVIALTFSDQVQATSYSTSTEEYVRKTSEWKSLISAKLISKGVQQKVVQGIHFVPTKFDPDGVANNAFIESLVELKLACIQKIKSRTNSSGSRSVKRRVTGICVTCVGAVFPPLLVVFVPFAIRRSYVTL